MPPDKKSQYVPVEPLDLGLAEFLIEGTSLYGQHRFPIKVKEQMIRDREEGKTKRKSKEKIDYTTVFNEAMYIGPEGQRGIPCAAFRDATIAACRLTGHVMTRAKLSIVCIPDFHDTEELFPMVQFTKGEPFEQKHVVRIQNTIDIACRAFWAAGWQALVKLQFDKGQFKLVDVANLLHRAGAQVGIGEGRNSSKTSVGMGWGFFRVLGDREA